MRSLCFHISALLLVLILAAGNCPLCPDGAQGPHDCCQRSQTTPCGHPKDPEPEKQPCPGGHPLFVTGSKVLDAGGGDAANAPDGAVPAAAAPAWARQGLAAEARPGLDANHSPPLYLLNSVLRA